MHKEHRFQGFYTTYVLKIDGRSFNSNKYDITFIIRMNVYIHIHVYIYIYIQIMQAAFENRSLRCISGKPPTYIDKSQTNENMYQEIESIYGCKFQHFSDTWTHAKLKVLVHILRTDRADPLFQVTFGRAKLHPREHGARRQGCPSADWLMESYRV